MKEELVMLKQLCFAALIITLIAGVSVSQAAKKDKSGSGKVTVVIHHEVKDYTAWKQAYDSDKDNRAVAGFKVSGVFTDAANPNMVTVIGTFPSAESANTFISNPKLKEAMEKGGVMGQPQVSILRKMVDK
jgi:hypothetical protein